MTWLDLFLKREPCRANLCELDKNSGFHSSMLNKNLNGLLAAKATKAHNLHFGLNDHDVGSAIVGSSRKRDELYSTTYTPLLHIGSYGNLAHQCIVRSTIPYFLK